jgi:hypothetical protein
VVRELINGLGADHTVAGLLALMSVLVLANAGIGAVGSYLLERTAESVVLTARRRPDRGDGRRPRPRDRHPH